MLNFICLIDVCETDKRLQSAVPWMSYLYLKCFPWFPLANWPLHLAARPVCLASVHTTQATVVSNRHAHLDRSGYFYSVKLVREHTHTSTHFKRTHLARQTFHTNERALSTWRHAASSSAGKSIRTSSRPWAPPDRVWSRPCRPAVKCPSANQRGREREREAEGKHHLLSSQII